MVVIMYVYVVCVAYILFQANLARERTHTVVLAARNATIVLFVRIYMYIYCITIRAKA